MRILGIDYGDSRIGVAVSDDGAKLAFDLCVVDATLGRKHAVNELIALIQKYCADTLVIGLPTNMNGTKGDRAEKCENFAKSLEEVCEIKTVLWDERLSTVSALNALDNTGTYGKKRKNVLDSVAAVIILQSYIDHRRLHNEAKV